MDTSTFHGPGDYVRHRHVENDPSNSNTVGNSDQREHTDHNPAQNVPHGQNSTGHHRQSHDRLSQSTLPASVVFMIICAFYIFIALFVYIRLNTYPLPKQKESSEAHEFIEENARAHLELITGLGPRVSGSEANYEAERYILHIIKWIRRESLSNHKIDVDIQRVSGGFTLDYANVGIGAFTSVYQNLTNIVVKLSPLSGAKESVLVNCHYDSVIDSPGAGDDATSCCVMLEILRAISRDPNINLLHSIVFLFNGAEENILQTSHGFITQHPWAKSIKAFVNLDSAGAGGWELLFQTGPDHPWLVRTYVEAAPHPHAACIAEEVFQTGFIPSDTDYRIFRDYGHIPGLDIAHIKNGYVYHTRNDRAHLIPDGCMQHGGENVKATLLHLASSSKVTNPGEERHGSMVYFDFLGYVMVAYPKRMAQILNWATFIFVYLAFLKRMFKERDKGALLRLTLAAMVSLSITWVIIVATALAMALLLSALGRELSYYTHILNIIWLFILPSVTNAISFHLVLRKTVFKNHEGTTMALVMQESNLMLWSVVLMGMTLAGLASSYIPLLCILPPALFYTVLELFGIQPSSLLLSMLGALVPSMYATYLTYMLLMFLVPIMGRRGIEGNPDLLISCLACIPVFICLPYHISFVYIYKRVNRVILVNTAVILLGLSAVLFTPAGFPYSSYFRDGSFQRVMLVHYDRRFHSESGHVHTADANIWYVPVDCHSTKHLAEYAPSFMSRAKQASCDGVYCGRPYLYPMLKLADAWKTLDFPASHLNVDRVSLKLTERQVLSNTHVRLSFAMTGPSHVTVFISEKPEAHIHEWDFGERKPVEVFTLDSMAEPTFFIYFSHQGNTTWHFSMDIYIEKDKEPASSLINIGLAGHYMNGPYKDSSDLLALEKDLPTWISPVTWTATYDEYVF